MSEATAEARIGKKLILTDLYTNWCRPCKVMDATTWADPKVIRESGNYVCLKLNAETEKDGIALARRLNISAFPTVLILDSQGSEFERLEGYIPPERFLSRLKTAINAPESLGNLKARESANDADLSLHFKVGKTLLDRSCFAEAQTRFETILERDQSDKSHLVEQALFNLALCQANHATGLRVGKEQESQLAIALSTIDRLRNGYPQSSVLPNASLLSIEILIRMDRRELAKAQLEDFLRRYPSSGLIKDARQLMATLNSLPR